MIKLEDKYENKWVFYIDNNKNLLYIKNNSETQILHEMCSDEFDVCFDAQGNIIIVFQLENGEMCYLNYNRENWKKYVILKNKNKKKCFNNIQVFCINNRIELFYCLFHNYKYYIIHHTLNSNTQIKPIVLDYCIENKFAICLDKEMNTHIVYKNENNEIIEKICNLHNKSYHDRRIMLGENVKDILCLCDNSNNLNLLYVDRTPAHYTIVFENISKNIKHILGFGTDSICKPIFYEENGTINVLWHERLNTYKCVSSNIEKGFSKVQLLGRDLESCKFKKCNLPGKIFYNTYKKS